MDRNWCHTACRCGVTVRYGSTPRDEGAFIIILNTLITNTKRRGGKKPLELRQAFPTEQQNNQKKETVGHVSAIWRNFYSFRKNERGRLLPAQR